LELYHPSNSTDEWPAQRSRNHHLQWGRANTIVKEQNLNQKIIHQYFQKISFYEALRAKSEEKIKHTTFGLKKKTLYLLSIAIIIILLTSVFAIVISANPNSRIDTSNYVEPEITDSPTEQPTPTNKPTPNATKKPTTTSTPGSDPVPYNPLPPIVEYPTTTTGIIESNSVMDSAVWRDVARQAWRYFEPGTGVDSNTGLPGAVASWPYFTIWDLGVYVQAVIDAQKLGLISKEGDWGADYRFDKVLTFLETCPLNPYFYPFWFYQATDGQCFPDLSNSAKTTYDLVDIGKLLVSLSNVKRFSPEFTSRIDDIVLRGRSDYAALLPDVQNEFNETNFYAYLLTTGFAAFWPNEVGHIPKQILMTNIPNSGVISVNAEFGGNVTIPQSRISGEALLHSVLDLEIADSEERSCLLNVAKQVYLAHEEYHNLTNRWVAFSEGGGGGSLFVYEWVYLPGFGSWKVTSIDRTEIVSINPIIYSKVALTFMAMYNTTYARDLCIYLEKSLPPPNNGWSEGADFTTEMENRNIVTNVSCNTNGMILAASRYYIQSH